MTSPSPAVPRRALTSAILIGAVIVMGVLLAAWKRNAGREAAAAAANQPEPVELVTLASAEPRKHTQATTAVGTVHALRSVTLRNEVAGTVRQVSLTPGADRAAGRGAGGARCVRRAGGAAGAGGPGARSPRRRWVGWSGCGRNDATSQEEVDQARAAA